MMDLRYSVRTQRKKTCRYKRTPANATVCEAASEPRVGCSDNFGRTGPYAIDTFTDF